MIIAACGMVCSDCEAYKATQANDPEWIARVAENWSKEYNVDIKPEYVWCDGCMAEGDRKCGHCGECNIRDCAIERNVANCAMCSDYGCEKIMAFTDAVPGVKETLDALRDQKQGL